MVQGFLSSISSQSVTLRGLRGSLSSERVLFLSMWLRRQVTIRLTNPFPGHRCMVSVASGRLLWVSGNGQWASVLRVL